MALALQARRHGDVVKDKDDENAQQVQAVQELSELGSGKIYGYDSAYDNSTKFSMGSAHKVTVTSSMLTGWKMTASAHGRPQSSPSREPALT